MKTKKKKTRLEVQKSKMRQKRRGKYYRTVIEPAEKLVELLEQLEQPDHKKIATPRLQSA